MNLQPWQMHFISAGDHAMPIHRCPGKQTKPLKGFKMRDIKEIPSNDEVKNAIEVLVAACHGRAWNAGWWHNIKTGEYDPRSHGDICSLIHSEVSEAYEGYRKDLMDDKLPQRKMFPVEIGDTIIRAFDAMGGLYPGDAVCIIEKMMYNDSRADHKPENRVKEGGKKL